MEENLMKKILPILLSILMLFSASSVFTSASDEYFCGIEATCNEAQDTIRNIYNEFLIKNFHINEGVCDPSDFPFHSRNTLSNLFDIMN